VHVEGEAEGVAGGEEVGEPVDVRGDVVGFLCGEVWEESLHGLGEDEGFGGRKGVGGGGRADGPLGLGGRRWVEG